MHPLFPTTLRRKTTHFHLQDTSSFRCGYCSMLDGLLQRLEQLYRESIHKSSSLRDCQEIAIQLLLKADGLIDVHLRTNCPDVGWKYMHQLTFQQVSERVLTDRLLDMLEPEPSPSQCSPSEPAFSVMDPQEWDLWKQATWQEEPEGEEGIQIIYP